MDLTKLLLKKEDYRTKHGLHIQNNMSERGSMNHKTKPYWTCDFVKRIKHPLKKGRRWNARTSYQTFDSYEEALVFSLEQADDVLKEMNAREQKAQEKLSLG